MAVYFPLGQMSKLGFYISAINDGQIEIGLSAYDKMLQAGLEPSTSVVRAKWIIIKKTALVHRHFLKYAQYFLD